MKLKGILFVLAVAAVWPATGNAASLHGVVVARSHGTVLVASANGAVQAARGSMAVGSRLAGSRVVGHADRARIHGVVVEHRGSMTFLSSNRHLLAVHDATPTQPGTVVNTTVGVRPNGELDEEQEDDVGQAGSSLPVQATITAVGAGTVTVSVNGQSLTLELPNGLTLPASIVGQTVTFSVALGAGDDDQGDNQGDNQGGDGGDHGGDHGGGGDD